EVPVRGRHQSDVDSFGARAAETLELLLLEHPEQLRLQLERDVADLVEEDRPLVRQLEPPDPLRDRTREGAPLVAEELALEETRRDGRAVELHERAFPTPAQVVNGA